MLIGTNDTALREMRPHLAFIAHQCGIKRESCADEMPAQACHRARNREIKKATKS